MNDSRWVASLRVNRVKHNCLQPRGSPHLEYTTSTMADTVDQKLLKQTKFPPEFNQKVDMQKVNIEVMKRYASAATIMFIRRGIR